MEHSEFNSVCGSLQWLATQSRPDLAFDTNQLQKRQTDVRVRDLLEANKVVGVAKKTIGRSKPLQGPWKVVLA